MSQEINLNYIEGIRDRIVDKTMDKGVRADVDLMIELTIAIYKIARTQKFRDLHDAFGDQGKLDKLVEHQLTDDIKAILKEA
jgi:hypothetical protein